MIAESEATIRRKRGRKADKKKKKLKKGRERNTEREGGRDREEEEDEGTSRRWMAKEAKGGGKTRLASRKALSWQLRSREKRFFLRARARMTTTTYDDDDVDGDNRKKLQESKPTVGGVDRGAFTPCYLPESCFAELSREWGTGSTRARIRLS